MAASTVPSTAWRRRVGGHGGVPKVEDSALDLGPDAAATAASTLRSHSAKTSSVAAVMPTWAKSRIHSRLASRWSTKPSTVERRAAQGSSFPDALHEGVGADQRLLRDLGAERADDLLLGHEVEVEGAHPGRHGW
jgi:hypothetical protein